MEALTQLDAALWHVVSIVAALAALRAYIDRTTRP